MDISQIQAMHAYIQQLNFQTASAVASTTPNLLAATNPLFNPALINPPPPQTSINDSLNPLTLAYLYSNQNSTTNNQVQQQHQPSRISSSQQIPVTTTTTMPLTFPQQQSQPSVASVAVPHQQQQLYNSNIQISELQKQIEQQAILNQLSQLISSLGQSQIPPPPQIGNVYHPQNFQHQSLQHQSAMSKPPILTPSQPIQIPKSHQLQQLPNRQSLPTPENIRKRRHRDVEMISSSQSSSQSGSPNNNNININVSRTRAFTCPETMNQQQQQQKDQSDQPSSPDKIAKFDPSCPRRHHPDNLSPPNEQAMMLEQITTAYILNALGESAYKASDPTTTTENKSKQCGAEITKESEKSGSIVKIPMSEIHRMIEDCYNDL